MGTWQLWRRYHAADAILCCHMSHWHYWFCNAYKTSQPPFAWRPLCRESGSKHHACQKWTSVNHRTSYSHRHCILRSCIFHRSGCSSYCSPFHPNRRPSCTYPHNYSHRLYHSPPLQSALHPTGRARHPSAQCHHTHHRRPHYCIYNHKRLSLTHYPSPIGPICPISPLISKFFILHSSFFIYFYYLCTN